MDADNDDNDVEDDDDDDVEDDDDNYDDDDDDNVEHDEEGDDDDNYLYAHLRQVHLHCKLLPAVKVQVIL